MHTVHKRGHRRAWAASYEILGFCLVDALAGSRVGPATDRSRGLTLRFKTTDVVDVTSPPLGGGKFLGIGNAA